MTNLTPWITHRRGGLTLAVIGSAMLIIPSLLGGGGACVSPGTVIQTDPIVEQECEITDPISQVTYTCITQIITEDYSTCGSSATHGFECNTISVRRYRSTSGCNASSYRCTGPTIDDDGVPDMEQIGADPGAECTSA